MKRMRGSRLLGVAVVTGIGMPGVAGAAASPTVGTGPAVSATFRRLHGRRPARLRVTVDYRGTPYVAPANRVDHVTAG